MAKTGNKGEWSEIYTLFKLLGDKQVFAGDANLNRIEALFYPIIKILRSENDGNHEYMIDNKANLIFISDNNKKLFEIPILTFRKQATQLLSEIKSAQGSSFSIPETEKFMNTIACKQIKAKSTDKSDIKIVIHDLRTNANPLLGFSIKSQLGGASTLLNAGNTTNFIYNIKNLLLSDNQVNKINQIDGNSKIKDRIFEIKHLGGHLEFQTTECEIFKNNLTLIDSLLPDILAACLQIFFSSDLKTIKQITDKLEKDNPLHFDIKDNHRFYEYKMKRFLVDVALGMMPSKVWNGQYDATGGYLIVKDDGNIVCYHIYNRNDFESYLYNNTKFETASSTRHNFGTVEKIDGKQILKLNLQIRFTR